MQSAPSSVRCFSLMLLDFTFISHLNPEYLMETKAAAEEICVDNLVTSEARLEPQSKLVSVRGLWPKVRNKAVGQYSEFKALRVVWRAQPRMAKILGYPTAAFRGM